MAIEHSFPLRDLDKKSIDATSTTSPMPNMTLRKRWRSPDMTLPTAQMGSPPSLSMNRSKSILLAPLRAHRSSFHHSGSIPRQWRWFVAALICFQWGLFFRTQSRWKSSRAQLSILQERHMQVAAELETATAALTTIQSKVEHLTDKNDVLLQKQERSERIDALSQRIKDLEHHIQEESKLVLEENSGKGPYMVHFFLSGFGFFHRRSILVEMAPNDLMPHAIHAFLRNTREWNGLSFVYNPSAPHLISAESIDHQTGEVVKDNFHPSLAFSEQSPEMGPYKACFTGSRDGGPEFHIHASVHTSGDSETCFGTVVSGQDVIDDIVRLKESKSFGIERVRLYRNKRRN